MYKADCDICGIDDYKVLGNIGENKLVKCMKCGHRYMYMRHTKEELAKFYNEHYFNSQYETKNEMYSYKEDKPNILKFVEKRFATLSKYKKSGKMLDIGCAMGYYLEYAQKIGWEIVGNEISEYASQCAKELLKTENIINKAIEDLEFENEEFDVITMWLVFEHMNQPNVILEKISKWTKKGGIFAVKVPNGDGITFRANLQKWIEQHPHDHMCDYTLDTLERITYKVGFKMLECETEGIYLSRVTDKKQFIDNKVIEEFYNETAKKANIGDSLVMFFEKI